MKIGIISDTHDNAVDTLKAVQIFNKEKVSLVIHCGDWVSPFMPDFFSDLNCKVISVWGNNEGDIYRFGMRKQLKGWNIEFHNKTAIIKKDGKMMIVYHGDDPNLLDALIKNQDYDVVFSGHTHKSLIHKYKKTLHINPGSISGLRESKIVNERTIAIYNTKTDEANIINL